MTDFWPGQDPWNSFALNLAWEGAGEPDHARADSEADVEAGVAADPPHDVAFVEQAIQRVYHP